MKNQFAKYIIEDGQAIRPIVNYINNVYDEIKNKKLFDGTIFKDRIEFLEHVKNAIDTSIDGLKAWQEDDMEACLKDN